MGRAVALGLTLAALTAACAPAPTATPTIMPVQTAYVSPFIEPVVVQAMIEYHSEIGPLPFDLERRLHPTLAVQERDGSLAFAPPPVPQGWFAAPYAEESLAIITHPETGRPDLSIAQLAGLFTGRLADWSAVGGQPGRVQPVIPVEGDSLRSRFAELVLGDQRFAQHSILAASPDAAIKLVQEDPGALAFIPASSLTGGVTVVRIEGASPIRAAASGRYPLTIEILVLSEDEPQGPVREFLIWTQARGVAEPPG